ncbi:MAG: response regulator [Candidatus Omnitrophota bacterium]|jgi:CheY-like chemotaxis protein|nr:MAG: response regulator [Candidatus Omnitrophota bacterium]
MTDATILIVDDEEDLRENLRDLLEFSGYTVMSFASGEEILERFDDYHADVVLLDIQLPGKDGLEVLREIKRKRPDLPVAMVSASSVRGVLAKAEEYGANRTIIKPYSPKEMLQMVETMLAERNG